MIMSREAFHSGVYAQYVIPNGARPIRVAKDWLDWPLRSQVTKIDYLPGVDSGVVDSAYNKWPGWGVDSMAGDVTPWLELTELQIPDAALRHEFTCMLAWPLQNPGKKMTKFCHLWGPPGTGKNAVLVPLMFIYGRNGIILGKDDITRDFQDLIPFRQMIVFDELHPGDKQSAVRLMNKLKPFITGASLMINPKGMPQFEIANRMNVVTLSNYADGIRLDDGDRRAFVLGFTNLARKGDKDWWDSYYAWAGDPAGDPGPGCAALMDYLMGYDTSSFDPHGEAMMTDDKALITVAARNGLEQWVMQLAEDPELVLTPVMRGVVLVENDELARFAFADEQHVTGGMKVQLGLAMLGTFKRTCQIKVGGKPRRFWIIRRKGEEWDDNDKIRGQLKLQQFPGAK
jgi:hypothetical protein